MPPSGAMSAAILLDSSALNTTTSEPTLEPSSPSEECLGGLSDSQIHFYIEFTFWVEGVGQTLIGLCGLIANMIVIPILCR